MTPLISIIIPNRNGEATIRLCLEAVYRSDYTRFEVIVVDDDSEDRSVAEIERFPCRLVRLDSCSLPMPIACCKRTPSPSRRRRSRGTART
jgi:glycosyltransferase involved in cell wall biosynthesis